MNNASAALDSKFLCEVQTDCRNFAPAAPAARETPIGVLLVCANATGYD